MLAEAKLSGGLKGDLKFRAELLKRMDRPREAQAKLDEAAKLYPVSFATQWNSPSVGGLRSAGGTEEGAP